MGYHFASQQLHHLGVCAKSKTRSGAKMNIHIVMIYIMIKFVLEQLAIDPFELLWAIG